MITMLWIIINDDYDDDVHDDNDDYNDFSFAPDVAAVCRRFPMFVGFEANKAAEGEHLAQTLAAKQHCP